MDPPPASRRPSPSPRGVGVARSTMFKLSRDELGRPPSLPGGDLGRASTPGTGSRKFGASRRDRAKQGAGIKLVDWSEQSIKSADGLAQDKDFRSAAVYAEVKLAEALNRRAIEKKLSGEDDSIENPDVFRAAFCVHLLSELCNLSGPFGKVLTTIRDELAKAIYSDYYATQQDNLIFEQQTFFNALSYVEGEKEELLKEREEFHEMISERENEIDRIEENIKGLAKKLADEKQSKATLQNKLTRTEKELGSRTQEFKLCADDLKQARQTLLRTSDELAEIRGKQTEKAKQLEQMTQEMAAMKAKVETLTKERDTAQSQLKSYQSQVSGSVPKQELDRAKHTIDELEARIMTLSSDFQGSSSAKRVLTPRPDWKSLDPFDDGSSGSGTTKDIAEELVLRLRKSLAQVGDIQAQFTMMERRSESASGLLRAEPDPTTFFEYCHDAKRWEAAEGATEGAAGAAEGGKAEGAAEAGAGGAGEGAGKPAVLKLMADLTSNAELRTADHRVDPLGFDEHVPRYLRHAEPLDIKLFTLAETKELVHEIWSEKDEYDSRLATHTTLQAFLLEYLLQKFGSGNFSLIAGTGYSVFLSLHSHQADAEVAMFLRVLEGKLSEYVHFDYQCMISSFSQEVEKLLGPEDESVSRADLGALVDTFFLRKKAANKGALKEALKSEQKGSEIDFSTLFDDEEGGPFLQAVLTQYIEESLEYTSALSAKLLAIEEKDENGFTSLVKIRDILATYDPERSEDDLYLYITRGARLASIADAKLFVSLNEEVEITDFVKNLMRGLVRHSNLYKVSEYKPREREDAAGGGAGGGSFLTDMGDFSTAQPNLA